MSRQHQVAVALRDDRTRLRDELTDAEKRIEELEELLARKNKIILLLALGDEPQQLHADTLDP